MEKLKFFDLKGKKTFESEEYRIETRKNRRFAVAQSPSGVESWRILPNK